MITIHNLLIVNAVITGMLFAAWERKNFVNLAIKLVLLGVLIFNLYFLFGGK